MKNHLHFRRGFTLLELLIAVTISSIVIVVMLTMTGVVADAWRNGNNKVFTNNEARAAFNRLAEDLESAVIRDNIAGAEWFVATSNPADFGGSPQPANPTWLMFYSTPSDRQLFEYQPGSLNYDRTKPIPGNVVTLSYKIVPQDPIKGGNSEFNLYGLYRAMPKGTGNPPNPAKVTFDEILGKPNLKGFWSSRSEASDKDNFYISNIFDFSFTFWISKYNTSTGLLETVAMNPSDEIRVTSEGVWVNVLPTPGTPPTYPGGKLASVDISMTILTQEGARRVRDNDIPGSLSAFAANPDFARTFAHKVYFAPEAQRAFR
jgi:prepilin-type N-terminal cleavage/methylation domain-containing protein